MSVFDHHEFDNHEHVAFHHDAETGLKAIIAIHNSNLGPSLGGCRMWPYSSSEEALTDVLRLSKGMTYKAAIANLAQGGGKSVIIGDARKDKTPEMMRAMGRFVESLSGMYYTAEDSGMSVSDLQLMAEESDYIAGTQAKYHPLGGEPDGNPAPSTAYGVFVGLREAVNYALKSDLSGVSVAIQGVGHVGFRLARHLYQAGAKLYVSDIYDDNLKRAQQELDAVIVDPNEILSIDVDVLAPCALGAALNERSIPSIRAKVIAGAANNQLEDEALGEVLMNRGIVYAPDYVINSGGIIDIYHQRIDSSNDALKLNLEEIATTLREVLDRAAQENTPTNVVANKVAEERFNKR